MCLASRNCVARHLLCSTWNIALSEYISLDKERGAITPGRLLAAVQKTVGAFVVGCVADEYVSLENPEPFVAYIQKPYDARNIFRDIEQGLGLCADISVKMETVCKMTGEKEAPAEKPRRKPQPATEPEAAARNRWMGLEI